MLMAGIFRQIGGRYPKRSAFDLSHDYKFTCDIGKLIPILSKEAIPGDYWQIGNEVVVRLQPLASPIMHELNVYVHYYFVPHRILWKYWEDFITGGKDGDFAVSVPAYSFNSLGAPSGSPSTTAEGSLWDYLGYPTVSSTPSTSYRPRCFRQRAYNLIWYEYYRDQNLARKDTHYQLINDFYTADDHYHTVVDVPHSSYIYNRCWEKDYFTSALPSQQRGSPVALPIRGSVPLDFSNAVATSTGLTSLANVQTGYFSGDPGYRLADGSPVGQNIRNALNKGVGDLSNASSFDVNEMRLAFQIQRWMELNMRAGARYTEFLKAHYAAFPRDERLMRPEYIGGSKSPVIISEVLQTSATEAASPQGTMSGHGITVDMNFCCKYRVQEHGTIMGIMSVIPRTAYQQGIPREDNLRTKYDYFFPEFQHLGEQEVRNSEIYANYTNLDDSIFGYQGRYNEYRYAPSRVAGEMRSSLNYWHMGRIFANRPYLNHSFVQCVVDKRNFLVQNSHSLLVNFANRIRAVRPMVRDPSPGLIDH